MANLNSVRFSSSENEVDLEGCGFGSAKCQMRNYGAIFAPGSYMSHANFGRSPREQFVIAL